MSEPRNYETEAVVIRKTKLGEADSIITFFTPHLGKIQGFAKSVRKPKSKLAGHLELLTYSNVSLARGRNLLTITGSQSINSYLPLKSDLWLTSCALYLAELVNQFSADNLQNYPLFQLLLETMDLLCQADNKDLVMRYFEMKLLDTVGFRPQLNECVACHQPLVPVVNAFSPGSGGMLCPLCAPKQPWSVPVSVNAQKVLRLLQKSDYPSASRVKIDSGLAAELKRILGNYIRYILEREVKSAAWLDTLREEPVPSKPEALR